MSRANRSNDLHWVGFRDTPTLSALLSDAFAGGARRARLRFACKLLVTPHLTFPRREVVVGVDDAHLHRPVRRLLGAISWITCRRGQAFNPTQLPPRLARTQRWRVINLAAAPQVAPATVQLARNVMTLADQHGVELEIEFSNERLRKAYLRHGFVPSDATDEENVRYFRPPNRRRRLKS